MTERDGLFLLQPSKRNVIKDYLVCWWKAVDGISSLTHEWTFRMFPHNSFSFCQVSCLNHLLCVNQRFFLRFPNYCAYFSISVVVVYVGSQLRRKWLPACLCLQDWACKLPLAQSLGANANVLLVARKGKVEKKISCFPPLHPHPPFSHHWISNLGMHVCAGGLVVQLPQPEFTLLYCYCRSLDDVSA